MKKNLGNTEDDKRDVDGRLNSANTAIMAQEEQIRRNERELKVKGDKISTLERALKESDDSNKVCSFSEMTCGNQRCHVTILSL